MTNLARIEDLDDLAFDPHLSDEAMFGAQEDPYPVIAALREKGPVAPGLYRELFGQAPEPIDPDLPTYTVLSYAAVQQVMGDPATFSQESFDSTLRVIFGPILTVMEPPEHTLYRRAFQTAFSPQAIRAWGADIVGPVVDELLGEVRALGRAELVGQFTRPFPFRILYRMLDLPPEDIDTFYRLMMAQLLASLSRENAHDAAGKLDRYFHRLISERRAAPGSDLISRLAQVEVDGRPMPEPVLVAFLRQLLSAGGETTFRSTSVMLTALLTHPDQLEAVRADRSLVAAAVEETLRWDGPVVNTSRQTTRDVVLDGVPVPAKAFLDVLCGAANRDPAAFEQPDRFDIFRPRPYHFAFARGVHNCIGQHLARLEMTRALNAFLDHLPNARLDPDAPPPVIRGTAMRTPRALHVVFD